MPTSTPQRPPHFKGLPFIGQLLTFPRDPLGVLEAGWRQLGDCFTFSIGPQTFYVVSHPDWVQRIYVEDKSIFQRPALAANPFAYLLGPSVLTTDGAPWLVKRRMLQPVFHRQRLAGFAATMVAAGERMLARWASAPLDVPVALRDEMLLVTLDIINRTMFGVDILPEVDKVSATIDEGLRYIAARTGNPFAPPTHWPTPANRRMRQAKAALDEFLYRLIRERRGQPARDDLLGWLLKAQDDETGAAMNDEQVRNEVLTVYAAGHETTATALTWTWYALNQHADVLRTLQQEVDTVLGGRLPTLADLPQLPYTLMVLEETLRLYAPIPLTLRLTTAPATIGGYAVPPGATVFTVMRHLHLHPQYWEHPAVFQPTRFAPDRRAQMHKNAYQPFLTGPHLCIGNHFALMEGQLLLALMVQRYTLDMVPGQHPQPTFLGALRPQPEIQVYLRPR